MNGYYLSSKKLGEYTISNCDTGEVITLIGREELKEFVSSNKVYGIGYINGEIQLNCKSIAMYDLDNIYCMETVLFKLNSLDSGRRLLYMGRHRGFYLLKEENTNQVISFTPEYLVENQAASVEIIESESKIKVPFKRYGLQKVPEKYKFSCKWSEFEFYKLAGQIRGSRVTIRYTGNQQITCLNCDLDIKYDEFVELPFTRVNDAKVWVTWEIKRE